MKLTTSLISAVAAQAAAVSASGCNVEGNLFLIEAVGKTAGNYSDATLIFLSPWGNMGTDTAAILDSYDRNVTQQTGAFYINKDNNRLIALDPFYGMKAANGYTDKPEGGELKFTFFNDTSRDFYFPAFDINEDGYLTADGKSIFTHCGPDTTLGIQGSLSIGSVAGENCKPLDYLRVDAITSKLALD